MDNIENTLKYAVLKPALFLHGFVKGKDALECNYEKYLTEILNLSKWFYQQNNGEKFVMISEQSHGEPDIVCNEYALDYKLLLSSTEAEGKRFHSQQITMENGWIAYGVGADVPGMRVTRVHRLFDHTTVEDIERIAMNWSKNNIIEKDIHNISRTVKTDKNIMLYLPYLFLRNDLINDLDMKRIIRNELEGSFKVLFQYRDSVLGTFKYDTFLTCLYAECFLLFKWSGNHLQLIDEIEAIKSASFYELVSLYDMNKEYKQYFHV